MASRKPETDPRQPDFVPGTARRSLFVALLMHACFDARDVALVDIATHDVAGPQDGGDRSQHCWGGGLAALQRLELRNENLAASQHGSETGWEFAGNVGQEATKNSFDPISAEQFSLECAEDRDLSDRKGSLTVGFVNNTPGEVCLVKFDGPAVAFFFSFQFYAGRSTCFCSGVGLGTKHCGNMCDFAPLIMTGTTCVPPCEAIISGNETLAWGAPGDGHKFVECRYSCSDELFGEVTGICQQARPVTSGDYEIAFCAAERAIPFDSQLAYPTSTAVSLRCPAGYMKVLKTVSVGKDDAWIVVPIEKSDLSTP